MIRRIPIVTPKRLDIRKTCQNCTTVQKSTRLRAIYAKDYVGPCSDSFCFASCDSSSCRPINVHVCDPCAARLSK